MEKLIWKLLTVLGVFGVIVCAIVANLNMLHDHWLAGVIWYVVTLCAVASTSICHKELKKLKARPVEPPRYHGGHHSS